MSAKWQRNKAWEREAFPKWAAPARWVLHAFSTIALAVTLLTGIAIYSALASVPIGMLARIPTYLVYGLTAIALIAAVEAIGIGTLRLVMRPVGRRWRIGVLSAGALALAGVGAVAWGALVWPHLRYDFGTGEGFMLFADFIEANEARTLRRLPALEMTELEFYAWWPMRLMLIAFVANMVVATIRRIEFRFVNLGVLTVHTGIVVIALGSLYYSSVKQEGDALLRAGPPGATGEIAPGAWQTIFYDSTETALHVRAPGESWLQLPVRGVPRYNGYNLSVTPGPTAWTEIGAPVEKPDDGGRTLDIEPPPIPPTSAAGHLSLRIIGYAPYVREGLMTDWVKAGTSDIARARARDGLNPLREIAIEGDAGSLPFFMLPERPKQRLIRGRELEIEYLLEPGEDRIEALSTALPSGTLHGAIVEVPEAGFREVLPLVTTRGRRAAPIPLGETGYSVRLQETLAEPSLPLVTPGYEGAHTSLIKLRVSPPDGTAYTRWVHFRFPEIAQDFVGDQPGPDGRPQRRDAEPGLEVTYIDATKAYLFLVEREDGSVLPIFRQPGGSVRTLEVIEPGGQLEDLPTGLRLDLGERWAHAERFQRPVPVPRHQREKDMIGTHDRAALAVELTSERDPEWRRIVWLPFVRYLDQQADQGARTVALPDGQTVRLAFGRRWQRFPGFALRLEDFRMISYEHRGAPRDYQSGVSVRPTNQPVDRFAAIQGPLRRLIPAKLRERRVEFEPFTHVTRLNAPLRAPYNIYDESRGVLASIAGRIRSGLNPHQFKLAQSGWDRQTWNQTQEAADAGRLDRPFVRFTILHVGNNAGIHIIALGGVLMGVGIPWAFYVKPWILRRRKRRIQRDLAQESPRLAAIGGAAGSDQDTQPDQRAAPAGAAT